MNFPLPLNTVAIATVLVLFVRCASADTYSIRPSSSASCFENDESVTCLTLSEFATNQANSDSNAFNSSNITLVLLPGNHILDTELVFIDVSMVAIHSSQMLSNISDTYTMVTCDPSARLSFLKVLNVTISGLKFSGCIDNTVTTVEQFTLDNCTLVGRYRIGTGLQLTNVTSMNIIGSTLSKYTGLLDISTTIGKLGGAICANFVYNFFVCNSTFTDNTVGSNTSVVTLDAQSGGGAISVVNSFNVMIIGSNFSNNSVRNVFGSIANGTGGAVAIKYLTPDRDNVNVLPFTLESLSISVFDCVFTENTVASMSIAEGGALSLISSISFTYNVSIQGCTFTNNSVVSNDSGFGGAVFSNGHTVMHISDATFSGNSAVGGFETGGGAVFARGTVGERNNSLFMIYESSFKDNFVCSNNGGRGGAVSSIGNKEIVINNSAFLSNTLQIGNGTAFGGAVFAGEFGDEIVMVTNSFFSDNSIINRGTDDVSAAYGGAVCALMYAVISNTIFSNNAVHLTLRKSSKSATGGAATLYSSCVLINSTFFNNSVISESSGLGGAVDASAATLLVNNSVFHMNRVISRYSGYAGAFSGYLDVSVLSTDGSTNNAVISNTTFSNNSVHIERLIPDYPDEDQPPTDEENDILSRRTRFAMIASGGALVLIGSVDYASISDCNFSGNSMTGSGLEYGSGSGGAVALFSTTVNLKDNIFIENLATGFGGAIVIESSNLTSSGVLDIQFNSAINGALFAFNSHIVVNGNTIASNNNVNSLRSLSMQEIIEMLSGKGTRDLVNFFRQFGDGGGVTLHQSQMIIHGTATLANNTASKGGAIFLAEGVLVVHGNIEISCNLAQSGGGIYLQRSDAKFNKFSSVTIAENIAGQNGGGMFAIASVTDVLTGVNENISSSVQFLGNHAAGRGPGSLRDRDGGGGIYLAGNSRLYVRKVPLSTSIFEFVGNSAPYRGALYVSDRTSFGVCLTNPQQTNRSGGACFLQIFPDYSVLTLVQSIVNSINLNTVNFTNNSATESGAVLYGGLLDRCFLSSFAEIFNLYNSIGSTPGLLRVRSYLTNITNLHPYDFNTTATVSSEAVRVCFCRNGTPDCNYQPAVLTVRRAQLFPITLAAVDQIDNAIPSIIFAGLSSEVGGLDVGQSRQSVNDSCTQLNYSITVPSKVDRVRLFLYASGPCNSSGISQRFQNVNFLPCDDCPIGLMPDEQCVCSECDTKLSSYVTSCSLDTESALPRNNYWINYTNDTGFTGHQCPFDYCRPSPVNVNLSSSGASDRQCASNRSGWLCGECKPGFSLSLGSSRCRPDCTNYSLFLIIPFALFGVALIALLLFCNLTVAIGTINGLVFYANIVSANRALFIPSISQDGNVLMVQNPLTVFISWINLDFGIETCFYRDMNAFAVTWLQFAFPLYIIIVVILIIIVSKYSVKVSRLVTSNTVPCLATLLLLSYTKILRAIITALSFTDIDFTGYNDNGYPRRKVWLFDGNVEYLQDKHILLFVVALLLLLLGSLFTAVLLTWQCLYPFLTKSAWLRRSSLISNANHFIEAYNGPFKNRHRYWPGLLLIVRAFLYLISAINVFGNLRDITLLSIIVTMVILLLYQSLVMNVYKSWVVGFLENTSIANLAILATLTFFTSHLSADKLDQYTTAIKVQAAAVYLSIGITFATFICVVIYHTYKFIILKNSRKLPTSRQILKRKVPHKPNLQENLIKDSPVRQRRGGGKNNNYWVDRLSYRYNAGRGSLSLILEEPTDEDYARLGTVSEEGSSTPADKNLQTKFLPMTHATITGIPTHEENSCLDTSM